MTSYPCFSQDCPHCGSKQYIRVLYLGRRVPCRHCDRDFLAADRTLRQAVLMTEAAEFSERNQQSPWRSDVD